MCLELPVTGTFSCSELLANEALGKVTTLTSLWASGCPKVGNPLFCSLASLHPLTGLQCLQLADSRKYSTKEMTGKRHFSEQC